jgi:hypothetical protein
MVFGLNITLRIFWQMMRIADFTGLPLKVSIGHPSASLRHHGSTFLADWYSIAARASIMLTGSPRRILSLISSKMGSAEQGVGGQQPPVESFGVFIDFWREAVPHLVRSAETGGTCSGGFPPL